MLFCDPIFKRSIPPIQFIKELFVGRPVQVVSKGIKTGNLTPGTLRKIHSGIEALLGRFEEVKIGKTGQPKKRASQEDYHDHYKRMYLLYRSKSRDKIDKLEIKLIDRYYDKLDNISNKKGGNMVSRSGNYYIYVVVR